MVKRLGIFQKNCGDSRVETQKSPAAYGRRGCFLVGVDTMATVVTLKLCVCAQNN